MTGKSRTRDTCALCAAVSRTMSKSMSWRTSPSGIPAGQSPHGTGNSGCPAGHRFNSSPRHRGAQRAGVGGTMFSSFVDVRLRTSIYRHALRIGFVTREYHLRFTTRCASQCIGIRIISDTDPVKIVTAGKSHIAVTDRRSCFIEIIKRINTYILVSISIVIFTVNHLYALFSQAVHKDFIVHEILNCDRLSSAT